MREALRFRGGGIPGSMLGLTVLLALALPGRGWGQEIREVRVLDSRGQLVSEIPLVLDQGFAAFRALDLGRLGWEVMENGQEILARWGEGPTRVEARVRVGTPFLSWDGEGVQLAHAPFSRDGSHFLPVQFLVDVLPWKLPGAFRWNEAAAVLERVSPGLEGLPASPGPRTAASGSRGGLSPNDPLSRRVVVIDAGHGGRDPGAKGPGGTQEKDVALGIAEALARVLREDPGLEVHLTRDRDELIPLWQRGELATGWKGERHGIFVSIHANALPNSRSTRGFETYFLSEARTEHERRVAALENASMELEDRSGAPASDPDLNFILTELRNLDHQHWSALLADLIQRELDPVHPGPDRGVKQGPFAVITNALMPAVLLEVGFITNPEEERLLRQESFQEDSARAVAKAIREFFRRYPPNGGVGPREGSGAS